MLKSMTAYGRATTHSPLGNFVCEIQSLNRKFLEIYIQIPPELASFEAEVRQWISSSVGRGKVSVKIHAAFEELTPVSIKPNIPLARQVKSACTAIAEAVGLKSEEALLLQVLGNEPGLLLRQEAIEDTESYRAELRKATDKALASLVEMKAVEGKTIHADFVARCSTLAGWISAIEAKAAGAVDLYREKIKSRIEEHVPTAFEHEDRLLREICLFAEKVDISEELTRFRSHLKQFDEMLNSGKEGVGKTLEFLLQELHRETNTIGSKSTDLDTSRLVVEIKSELEKIREQVQNVE